jgi:hypothetical protein
MSDKIRVEKFDNNRFFEWQNFVRSSVNGTIFHEQAFISYHPKDRFDSHSLMLYNKKKLRMVFPAAIQIRENPDGSKIKVLRSHPGTSYGGPVIHSRTYYKECFDLMHALERYAKEQGCDRIEFRTPPDIFQHEPSGQLEYSFYQHDYKIVNREIATAYDLAQYKGKDIDYFLRQGDSSLDRRVRVGVRRGIESGMEFKRLRDADIPEFHDLLTLNLKRHGATAVHTADEIQHINSMYPNRCELFGVYYQGKLVAGYYVMTINDIGRNLFYITMDYEVQHLRPNNFGIANLLLDMARQGFKYMNMGISTEDGGARVNTQLLGFKESFGGLGIIRTYWGKDI